MMLNITTASMVAIWTVLSLVLAIAGGILIYIFFIRNKAKFSKNVEKFRDLLDFKVMLIEPIMKILYYVLTIYVVLVSFSLVMNPLAFLVTLVFGPVILRIIYEVSMMFIMIWKNTKEINEKLNSKKKD